MSTIQVKIEAYGAIERQLPPQLALDYPSAILVGDVLHQITEQFPQAEKALERCACAIGEDIVSRQATLKHDCTLVLLSPVAGG
ncbi:MoaD/ThiS family protein [Acinetobacter sp. S40]|uniref:MoaD/ThiS family protein n=1 Tax=unclassified Acinetobacter TaxID=196816 RepID=UPI0019090ED4|nr:MULTISPECIES: MoaD/ThiS family protein [unclassified Acinetobacter]MBJ9985199.1 MoaD/ThiS family protein [Acinetobacter sp. S40]MBK0063315.1 MoaD/ThiS family protein [Acinetobacter sp. S55]MBK0066773.1 MoaD/ThiS family protein [Acinetobacter sp. S54]